MYLSFGVQDSAEDALHVLAWSLGVFALLAKAHLTCLECGAGLPLVRDADRGYMHRLEGNHGVGILAAMGNHFHQGGVGVVNAILSSPVALGYPYTFPLLSHPVAQLSRQGEKALVIFTGGTTAADAVHLVHLSQQGHEGNLEQVGPDDHVSSVQSHGCPYVLQHHGVQHYVAVVGDKQGGTVVHVFCATEGEVGHGIVSHPLAGLVHESQLKLTHTIYGHQLAFHLLNRGVGKQP